ncbi:phosphate ABC transporter permease subunit PstC [Sporosarcina ureae]|uniref:phosphate ABC transporter permease subunit PstC n=1 Tax=Sporosarcina ureae TaxID=1571 RepID=UPI0026EBA341|nr:phosphate ABC transporter permease subunit PstC [Sporosarcina ureae]
MAKMIKEMEHPLYRKSNKMRMERIGKWMTFLSVALTATITAAILFLVFSKGLSTFITNDGSVKDFFTGTAWNPAEVNSLGKPIIGALPFLVGSIAVTGISALIAAPLAIGAAIFMSEIAPRTGKRIMQPVIELLVGIPSVVYGFIGLTVVVPFLRNLFPGSGFGIAAGTIVLSIMILPTVTSLAFDAIQAVPRSFREASLALGSTRWQMICKVVLKTAKPGLMMAIIFGMARAFGEALAVQMVIGNAAVIPQSLFDPASTVTSVLTMGMGYSVMGQVENNALWSLALVLLLMSLFFTITVRMIGKGKSS